MSRLLPGALPFLAFLAASVAMSAGCSGTDPYDPGTKLGTFHVTGKLVRSSCGPAPNPWEFDVRLNYDRSTLYWVQGGAPIEGHVDASAKTQLESEVTQQLRAADARRRLPACAVTRSDLLAVTLAADGATRAPDPSRTTTFTGALSYSFTPTDGSDCSDQLKTSGGDFDALPCEVQYDVVGVVRAPTR